MKWNNDMWANGDEWHDLDTGNNEDRIRIMVQTRGSRKHRVCLYRDSTVAGCPVQFRHRYYDTLAEATGDAEAFARQTQRLRLGFALLDVVGEAAGYETENADEFLKAAIDGMMK